MTMNWPQIAAGVYQACCTYDHYLQQLNAAVARSWGKVFASYDLSPDDLIAGVHKLYSERGSGFRPLPGDIAAAARAIREDRLARLPLPALEAHYQRVVDRVAPRVIELPESRPANVTIKYHRPERNPLLVACPHCHAPVGRPCTAGALALRHGSRVHPSRSDATMSEVSA